MYGKNWRTILWQENSLKGRYFLLGRRILENIRFEYRRVGRQNIGKCNCLHVLLVTYAMESRFKTRALKSGRSKSICLFIEYAVKSILYRVYYFRKIIENTLKILTNTM
jgi:hypothetical protein